MVAYKTKKTVCGLAGDGFCRKDGANTKQSAACGIGKRVEDFASLEHVESLERKCRESRESATNPNFQHEHDAWVDVLVLRESDNHPERECTEDVDEQSDEWEIGFVGDRNQVHQVSAD